MGNEADRSPDPRGIDGEERVMRLPVPLSDAEVAARSQELAAVIREYDDLIAERRESLRLLRERRWELVDAVSSRTDLSDVRVVDRLVVETRTVETVRLDTGVVVETRAATDADRQLSAAALSASTHDATH